MYRENSKTIIVNLAKMLLIGFVITMAALVFFYNEDLTIENIIKFFPSSFILSAIFLIVLHVIKSIILVFPVIILYIVSGIVFNPIWAIIFNTVGIFLSSSVSYYIGKFSGRKLTTKLENKYCKLNKLNSYIKRTNMWFKVYIAHVIGGISGDIINMYFGSISIPFKTFITATVAGKFMGMIFPTIMGVTINDPKSLGFILSTIATILQSIISIIIYYTKVKMDKRKANGHL